MRKFGFILLLLFGVSGAAFSREGYVRARDGSIYEGHIRFESNAVVVVSAAREVWERIPLTNVATVGLEPGAAMDRSPRASWTGGELPAPWRSVDVGSVAEAGSAEVREGGVRLQTAGTNLFGGSDSFQFVFKPVQGDSQLISRVLEVENSHPLAQAGLTMRESQGANARQVSFMMSARGGAFFGARAKAGDAAQLLEELPVRWPRWLKLTRHGDVFSAFSSNDGRHWQVSGKTRVSMTEEVLVGIGAVGIREGVLTGARVDQVREGRVLANEWFAPQVRLVGGSMQNGEIESMDDSTIRFAFQSGAPVATKAVANIRFRPVTQRVAALLHSGQPGLYLNSGEFVAGDVRGIRNGQVTVSSIPLGLLRYDVNSEVMAVVFRKPREIERQPCRLRTADGSVWLCSSMAIEGSWVVLKEADFGVRRVPVYEVVELQWNFRI